MAKVLHVKLCHLRFQGWKGVIINFYKVVKKITYKIAIEFRIKNYSGLLNLINTNVSGGREAPRAKLV